MISPLEKRIKEILKEDRSSFHTPGHKGKAYLTPGSDLTELNALAGLYENAGAIRESEEAYSEIYGSKTVLSAGGSTLGIQAMLALAAPMGGKILAGRVIHISAVNTFGLLDISPVWMFPEVSKTTGLAKQTTPQQVEDGLSANSDVKAVYITSPDYHGQLADIKGIAEVCHRYDKPLLVDNAHGAHLKFLPESLFPTDFGADICVSSAHKTLPVITGGAFVSFGDRYSREDVKKKMSIFGSTSPSYLILLSLDRQIIRIKESIAEETQTLLRRVENIKTLAAKRGMLIPQGLVDPSRITLGFGKAGYTKDEFLDMLFRYKVEPEYLDDYYCVLIPTISNDHMDFARLEKLLIDLEPKSERAIEQEGSTPPAVKTSVRVAMLSTSEEICVESAAGRIAGEVCAPCPPGIPVVIPGEEIRTEDVIKLKKHGILKINVI